MEITEVRVKLVDGWQHDKLKAYCSITIDDAFVVRDLKVIEGTRGLFVAMPSRKLTVRCPKCSSKTQVRSKFCSECGGRMPADIEDRSHDGRTKTHADIAHPINSECREEIQARVLDDYELECEAAGDSDYGSAVDEADGEYEDAPAPAGGPSDEFDAGLDDRAASNRIGPLLGDDRSVARTDTDRGVRHGADERERAVEAARKPSSEFDNFDNFSDGLFGA